MSPRAMRRYKAPILVCVVCQRRIVGEVRMVNGELRHPLCAQKCVHPVERQEVRQVHGESEFDGFTTETFCNVCRTYTGAAL